MIKKINFLIIVLASNFTEMSKFVKFNVDGLLKLTQQSELVEMLLECHKNYF